MVLFVTVSSGRYAPAVTPCSQSQIGRDRYLQRRGMAQVEAVTVLSVVVRLGPVKTAVNGTLVARPPRTIPGTGCAADSALTIG